MLEIRNFAEKNIHDVRARFKPYVKLPPGRCLRSWSSQVSTRSRALERRRLLRAQLRCHPVGAGVEGSKASSPNPDAQAHLRPSLHSGSEILSVVWLVFFPWLLVWFLIFMPFWGNFSLFCYWQRQGRPAVICGWLTRLNVVNSNVLIYIRGDLQAPDVTGCYSSFRAGEY